jgi:hypothetical protein
VENDDADMQSYILADSHDGGLLSGCIDGAILCLLIADFSGDLEVYLEVHRGTCCKNPS